MRIRLIAILALVTGALVPSAASAATGSLLVTVDRPSAAAARNAPPAVLAYPLDPAAVPVGAVMPRGRATLRLDAGPWVVATSVPAANGRPVVRAKLVLVAAGRRSALAAAESTPTIAIGTISVAPGVAGAANASFATTLVTAQLAELARKAPCPQRVVPGNLSRNPMWNAIQQATIRAAASGPPGVRAAATAAAAGLRGASVTTGTLSGTVTKAGGASGGAAGTFRVTDPSGRVTFERSYTGQASVAAMLDRFLKDALARVCAERRRVQVDVTIGLDARDSEARGVGVAVLSAVGIERVGPDGRVEKGSYEYESPVSWTTRDVAVQGLRCQVTLAGVDVGPPEAAPTDLVVERGGTFSVQLAPAILVGYSYVSPCNGTGSVPLSLALVPSLVMEVPGLDRAAERSGQAALGGATASYSASVRITRLPSRE